MNSVQELLERNGLRDHVPAFVRERVAVEDLPGITDEELASTFGVVSYGDRKRFRAMVRALDGTGATRLGPRTDDPGATRMGPRTDDPGATRMGPQTDDPGATRTGPRTKDAAMGTGPGAHGPAPRVGVKLLGRYYLVKELGRGAMGVVYKAVDEVTTGDVAVKVLAPELSTSARAMTMLLEEAATAQPLAHPNLLRINHVEGGAQPFIVMEYVDGDTLTVAWLERRRRFPADALRPLLTQLLEGLACLHERRIVHRDLKPDNIMITRDGRVKITDYGISATVRDQLGGAVGAGTPRYMSPEQLRGAICDGRSDLYAIGVMTSQLLTGELPFPADDVKAARAWHLASQRRAQTGSASFDAWIERMWAHDPQQRFTDARAAAAALTADDASATASIDEPTRQVIAAAAKCLTGLDGNLECQDHVVVGDRRVEITAALRSLAEGEARSPAELALLRQHLLPLLRLARRNASSTTGRLFVPCVVSGGFFFLVGIVAFVFGAERDMPEIALGLGAGGMVAGCGLGIAGGLATYGAKQLQALSQRVVDVLQDVYRLE
jgi:hypothetical protein